MSATAFYGERAHARKSWSLSFIKQILRLFIIENRTVSIHKKHKTIKHAITTNTQSNQRETPKSKINLLKCQNSRDKNSGHSVVVRPTAVRAISTNIICQTIVQHCRTSDLELTATCCVKLQLSLYYQIQT